MKKNSLTPPAASSAGLVSELHGMLNWLLIAAAFLIYAVINRLLLVPALITGMADAETADVSGICAVGGTLLMLLAIFPLTWHCLRLAVIMIRLRSQSTVAQMDDVFRRMRLLWRGVFLAAALSGIGYLLTFPAMLETEQTRVRQTIGSQRELAKALQDLNSHSERPPTEEEIAAKKHAEYIKKLEEDYYRQKREREAKQQQP